MDSGLGRRGAALALGLLLSVAPLISACSTSSDFAQLEPTDYERNVAMPTTTALQTSTTNPSRATTTPAPGPVTGSPVVVRTPDDALSSVVGQLTGRPELVSVIGQLASGDADTLGAVFGIEPEVMRQLSLSLEEVKGLAAIVAGVAGTLDPERVEAIVRTGISRATPLGGAADPAALQLLVELAGSLNATALGAIDGITQQVIGTVVSTLLQALDRVDPLLLALINALLDHLDPFGLGALSSQGTSGSLLAVFASAALRSQPEVAATIRPQVAADPSLSSLMARLESLGSTLDQGQANALTLVGARMTPEAFASLAALMTALDDPAVENVFGHLR